MKAAVFMPFWPQGPAAATEEAGARNTGYGWFETGTVSLKQNKRHYSGFLEHFLCV